MGALSQVRGLIVSPDNHPIKWEWLEEARGRVIGPDWRQIEVENQWPRLGQPFSLGNTGQLDLHTSRSEPV